LLVKTRGFLFFLYHFALEGAGRDAVGVVEGEDGIVVVGIAERGWCHALRDNDCNGVVVDGVCLRPYVFAIDSCEGEGSEGVGLADFARLPAELHDDFAVLELG